MPRGRKVKREEVAEVDTDIKPEPEAPESDDPASETAETVEPSALVESTEVVPDAAPVEAKVEKIEDAVPEEEAPAVTEEDTAAAVGDSEYAENDVYKKLISQGSKSAVADTLMKLFDSGSMSIDDVDERAVEMLNSFPEEQARYICDQLRESMLFGVQNKAQYLMSLMRNFRDRTRSQGVATVMAGPLITGPDREKLKELLSRTEYPLEITVGQRKYGGPCPGWEGPVTGPAGQGHEVYIGHIPHDLFEDALIPLFETCGKIWDLRLMMDPMTGKNRGYAFLTFCEKTSAQEAAKKYDGHEIVPGKSLKVNVSVANTRLFLGNIPKSKSKDEIVEELKKHAEGVHDVILYTIPDATERHKNRGFCFVDFVDHKTASDAKRKIQQHKIRPFNTELVVDWAEQQEEPDEDTMNKVKVLYVRNLKEVVTEEKLKEIFGAFGEIDRIKKIKDYAFIHFKERDPCVKALEEWNGKELEGVTVDCSLAKPQTDSKKRKSLRGGRGQGYGGGQGGGGGMGGGGGGFQGGRGGPGRANNIYPNVGYDDYQGGGYDMYGGGGGGYAGYGTAGYGSAGYGDYSMGGGYAGYGNGGGYGGQGGYPGGGGGGYGNGGGGWNNGGGGGGGARGGRGGGNRGGGFRGRGKRPGDRGGGPSAKRENGAPDFSADVNMSSF